MLYNGILEDIKGINSPVGEPDEDSKLYSAIDEQVMKFGTLQHGTIAWDVLIDSTVQYLTNVCKDYKIFQYFGYALLYQDTRNNLSVFLELFCEFNEKYLFVAYPKPSRDKTIDRLKKRTILVILNRLENVVVNKSILFSAEQNLLIREVIEKLLQQLSEHVTESAVIFNKILREFNSESIEQVILTSDDNEVPQNNLQHNLTSHVTAPKVEQKASVNMPDILAFDLSNERKLKQFYLQVAATTCEIDPVSVLGYISRRYGLWRNITRLPEMDAQGITAMQSVPSDKLMDYREAVSTSPDLSLLMKIEKTVVSSPYWIEGSYLAAQCCLALKFTEAAAAIKNVTKQFVDRHDDFSIAKFQNSEPFLPQSVQNWLEPEAEDNIVLNPIKNNFDDIYQLQGFVAVLRAIDEALSQAIDIRAHSYLQLDKIRYFLAEGLETLALSEITELLENSKKYSIEEWDGSFFKQLNQLKNQLA